MNKRAKRKAFFICLTICIMYISLAINITERIKMARVSEAVINTQKDMTLSMPVPQTKKQQDKESINNRIKEAQPEQEKTAVIKKDDDHIEPLFFISIPIVCYAIKKGILEKDTLIPCSNNTWKKPLQILQDRDEEGLRNLSKLIGRKDISDFLKREDIEHKEDINAENLLSGKGYVVNKARLSTIYEMHVGDGYDTLFPITLNDMIIRRTDKGFELVRSKSRMVEDRKEVRTEKEWIMPDLTNYSMRRALEKLNVNTGKIRIIGMGTVYDQSPKPHERVMGEVECILYGRVSN
ncbi:MAG: hypothetical protein N3D15_00620 [Syntrophorhabdaceae bacterium]|nr:hypothetical protein [Syntrophorhabdaceae bacterium]